MDTGIVVREIATLFVYMAVGFVLGRIGIVNEAGSKSMSNIVVRVALPALVLNSMLIEYDPSFIPGMATVFDCALVHIFFVYFLGGLLAKWIGGEELRRKTTHFTMIFGNVAFLGFPVISALFGETGRFYASFFVTAQNFFMWTVGVTIYEGRPTLKNIKKLINPGIIAIVIGVVCFFTRLSIPSFLRTAVEGVGKMAVPLSLITTGASFSAQPFKALFSNRNALAVTAAKNLLFPLLALPALLLIPIDPMLKMILLIQIASPVQASATAYASSLGGDCDTASKATVLTSLASAVTVPLTVALGSYLFM